MFSHVSYHDIIEFQIANFPRVRPLKIYHRLYKIKQLYKWLIFFNDFFPIKYQVGYRPIHLFQCLKIYPTFTLRGLPISLFPLYVYTKTFLSQSAFTRSVNILFPFVPTVDKAILRAPHSQGCFPLHVSWHTEGNSFPISCFYVVVGVSETFETVPLEVFFYKLFLMVQQTN